MYVYNVKTKQPHCPNKRLRTQHLIALPHMKHTNHTQPLKVLVPVYVLILAALYGLASILA